jgi:RNA polymerase sigma-70 factor (ECF subfamily)
MTTDARDTISGLLARARAGDNAALDRLFTSCRNYALILARTQVERWVQAKLDPSDLVQQSMLEAYRAFGTFQGKSEAELLAWLRRILMHNATDLARHYGGTDKRQLSREISLGAAGSEGRPSNPLEPADDGMSPSEQLLLCERELQLAEGLARLPADHREVILLRNLQALPFDEVAQRMGRSRPAVQMLWMRALRGLQTILEETMSGSQV